jgi:hypothetical protein
VAGRGGNACCPDLPTIGRGQYRRIGPGAALIVGKPTNQVKLLVDGHGHESITMKGQRWCNERLTDLNGGQVVMKRDSMLVRRVETEDPGESIRAHVAEEQGTIVRRCCERDTGARRGHDRAGALPRDRLSAGASVWRDPLCLIANGLYSFIVRIERSRSSR